MYSINESRQSLLLAAILISFSALCDGLTTSSVNNQENGDNYQALEVIGRSPIELVRLRGFKAELHYARTKDGYYLQLVHMINPLIDPKKTPLKRPVIFNHGFIESATIWLINSRKVEPQPYTGQCGSIPEDPNELNGTFYRNGPMMLANYGYDVWLMSTRGTDYSLIHEHWTPLDAEFWNFSLDELGLLDVPAVVNYVRSKTGAPKVGYVGHSQGTFAVFALLSTEPDYADVIEPIVAVAPVAYGSNATSVLKPIFVAVEKLTKDTDNGPFPSDARKVRESITAICATKLKEHPPLLCIFLEMLVAGEGKKHLKGYFYHLPFFTSLKVLRHIGQLVLSRQFPHYDYGPTKNIKVYGSAAAPLYKAGKIRSKSLCFIHSKSDAFASPKDVALLEQELTVPLYRKIFIDENFNHLDLLLNVKANKFVNQPILEAFESIELASGICMGGSRPKN